MSYNAELLQALLEGGADVHAQNRSGATASSMALYVCPQRFKIGSFEFSTSWRDPKNEIFQLLKKAETDRS
jgi:hypothetical protein